MKTLDKIITNVNCKYGAPMGRPNIDERKKVEGLIKGQEYVYSPKVFDCAIPLDKGGYDKGGAYWGIGKQLRVKYTKDLTFIEFYRID